MQGTQSAEHAPGAEVRMLEVGGQTVALTEQGSGPPLLLLHAAPAWSFIYRDFLASLEPRFRCIALDLPGFGLAPEPVGEELGIEQQSELVEAVLTQLDLRDVTLLVHDSAGAIGIGAAGRLPERIRGLVITDSFAWPLRDDFRRISRMLGLVTAWPLSLLQSRFNLIPWAAITTAAGEVPSRADRAVFLEAFGTPARRRRVLAVFRGLLEEDEFLERVEADLLERLADKPALVMFGADDPARKAGFEDRWREILRCARFRPIPGQMHFPHFGAAAAMCGHIVEWADALGVE